jgi:hypothetical protein
MKTIILTLFLLIAGQSAFSQFDRNSYQTQKTTIKVGIMKDGEMTILENSDINLVLDYGVGNLQVRLLNKDFSDPKQESPPSINASEGLREYFVRGILPINDILNQRQIKQEYIVELNFSSRELGINHPVRFDLTVTSPNPGKNQSKYRMFILHGTFYNSELQLPYFEGYEDEIEVWIKWTAYYIYG